MLLKSLLTILFLTVIGHSYLSASEKKIETKSESEGKESPLQEKENLKAILIEDQHLYTYDQDKKQKLPLKKKHLLQLASPTHDQKKALKYTHYRNELTKIFKVNKFSDLLEASICDDLDTHISASLMTTSPFNSIPSAVSSSSVSSVSSEASEASTTSPSSTSLVSTVATSFRWRDDGINSPLEYQKKDSKTGKMKWASFMYKDLKNLISKMEGSTNSSIHNTSNTGNTFNTNNANNILLPQLTNFLGLSIEELKNIINSVPDDQNTKYIDKQLILNHLFMLNSSEDQVQISKSSLYHSFLDDCTENVFNSLINIKKQTNTSMAAESKRSLFSDIREIHSFLTNKNTASSKGSKNESKKSNLVGRKSLIEKSLWFDKLCRDRIIKDLQAKKEKSRWVAGSEIGAKFPLQYYNDGTVYLLLTTPIKPFSSGSFKKIFKAIRLNDLSLQAHFEMNGDEQNVAGQRNLEEVKLIQMMGEAPGLYHADHFDIITEENMVSGQKVKNKKLVMQGNLCLGDIYKFNFDENILTKSKAYVLKDLLTGLSYMHDSLKMCHLDIKPHNVLVEGIASSSTQTQNTDYIYKMGLTDFSLSSTFDNVKNQNFGGTSDFNPPEVQTKILQNGLLYPDAKSCIAHDLWSLGGTLYFLFNQKKYHPLIKNNINFYESYLKIVNDYKTILDELQLQYSEADEQVKKGQWAEKKIEEIKARDQQEFKQSRTEIDKLTRVYLSQTEELFNKVYTRPPSIKINNEINIDYFIYHLMRVSPEQRKTATQLLQELEAALR